MQDLSFIFSLVILIISVVIHEVSHGFVANILGDPTARLAGRLTLDPRSHFDFLGSFLVPMGTFILSAGTTTFGWAKPVPYNPYNLGGGKWGPAMVAAAGPLSNLFIALVFGGIIRFLAGAGMLTQQYFDIAVIVIGTNLLLAVFNLVPIPPLDGSKVLFAVLPYSARGVQNFLEANQFFLVAVLVFFLWPYAAPFVDALFRIIIGV